MSRRHFDSTENAERRAKIDEAKRRVPLPELMRRLGYPEKHIGKTALCPFHDDQHPSFSVFKGNDGLWHYKCFVCDMQGGDEITFLVKHFRITRREAIKLYLARAGFPPRQPSESREYPASPKSPASPESPECPVCPVSPASPLSEGQAVDGELGKLLEALAAQNACTQLNTARTRRFKLLRDLKAVQKQIRRKLQIDELASAFDEWHRLSFAFLDPAKTRDYYEAKFLSEFSKVRFATGEGTLATALENVAKLSLDQLPVISGKLNAPESWRRLAALHRELSCSSAHYIYFLSYRDAAKVFDGMTHQEAHAITGALVTLGVIEIVRKGQAGLNSTEAAEFRHVEPVNNNGADEDDDGIYI